LYIDPENYRVDKRRTFKFRIKEALFKSVDGVFDKKDINKLEEII